ncbi:hypothetical protein JCM11251_001645 [Rhodosporidiobolus azoricus]
MSSYKRSHHDEPPSADGRSPPSHSRTTRRGRDDDDGEVPWWEQDRRSGAVGGGSSRGFDDDYPSSSRRNGGGGGYYDRDRVQESGGLPYDEPPRGPSNGGRGGPHGRSSRYDERDRDVRGGSGGRGGYSENRRGGRGGGYNAGGRGGYDRGGDRRDYDQQRDRRGSTSSRDDRRRSRSVEPLQAQRSLPSQAPTSAVAGSATSSKPADITAAPGTNGVEEGEIAPPASPPMDLSSLENPTEEPDPEAVLAERRRKRAEILAKYASAQASPAPDEATPVSVKRENEGEAVGTPGRQDVERAAKRLRIGTDSPAATSTTASTTADPSRATSADPTSAAANEDEAFSLEKDAKDTAAEQEAHVHETEVSAADYNPDGADDDREKRERRVAEQAKEDKREREGQSMVVEEEEVEEEEEEEEDDDEDDMFAIGTEKEKKPKKMVRKKKAAVPIVSRPAMDSTNASLLADNYDDPEGYYKILLGEIIDNGRYHVVANLGKGMFSNVVKARDLGVKGEGTYEDEGEEGTKGLKGKGVGEGQRRDVAIKVVRSQESMFKAGLKEAQILRRLREADPEDKKHLIRLLRTFEHRGHLCLVFESLSMNLREVVKRYGKDVGLNLRAVRAYASQMFLALALMKKCEIMHADLKPDNILVNESKSTLKVCDLGSASDVSENEITPYLVSRFYRAPEIILGLPYDCSLDVWSIACTLYELFTGKILFPGRTNNHMLLLIMETKGKFNHKLIRKARFHDQHFDENMNFLFVDKNDSVTPRAIASNPPSALRSRLMPSGLTRTMKDDDIRMLASFVDLLDKMLSLEPARRPTPKELLNHPFIRG